MRLNEAEERWILAALVAALFLFIGDSVGRNPDGLEMVALARYWRGDGPPLEDAGYWPPLWPGCIAVLMEWLDPLEAGRLLNLTLVGITVWPLYGMVFRLMGRASARLSVALYAGLPAVLGHAPVLDARPLGSFLIALGAFFTVEAAFSGKKHLWGLAFAIAALAGLARPEGLLLVPLVALSAWAAGERIKWVLPAMLLALLPALLRPGADVRGWEAYTGPWLGIWPNIDLLALFGPNTAPTGYRRFVQAAEAAGLVERPGLFSNLKLVVPGGLALVKEGLPGASGGLTLLLGVAGLVRALKLKGRLAVCVGGWGLLVVPMILLPMARDQATAATNFMFLVPLVIVGALFALQSTRPQARWIAPLAVIFCILESWYGPFKNLTPRFVEGTDAARTMEYFLKKNPPASGKVACRLSGRGIVRGAGLMPVALPSSWEHWEPEPGAGVILTSVDLRGTDGGRGIEVLEDPRFEVVFYTFEEQHKRWAALDTDYRNGRLPEPLLPSQHWLVYLKNRL
jgi:hypothetical protein